MDVSKTAGAFSWNELTTGDPQRAAAFYSGLFGWRIEDTEMPGMPGTTYRIVKTADGTPVGGILPVMPGAPVGMPPHWASYVTVDSVDATVAKARETGGSVLMEPMDIPGVGRMAVLRDPTGAVLSVITYGPM